MTAVAGLTSAVSGSPSSASSSRWSSESSAASPPAHRRQVPVVVVRAQADSSLGDTAGTDPDRVPTAFSTLAGVAPATTAESAVSVLLFLLLFVVLR